MEIIFHWFLDVGGERDYKKRPIMARIANNNCKKIYITDDNPRNEDPKKLGKNF